MSAGLTQEELAERAGISARGLRYLETGVRKPYRHTVLQISAALGLGVNEGARLSSVARGTLARPGDHRRGALPRADGNIIGREREANDLIALLREPATRLVSLLGPGGVGKTRLAVEVAERLEVELPDGVIWVALAGVDEPGLLIPAISQAIAPGEAPDSTDDAFIRGRLAGRKGLLVLDNFEHLAEAAAAVSTVLSACPGIHVLVTSRVALRLRAEHEYWLEPLPIPETGAPSAATSPALSLFVERARAIDHRFHLSAENAPVVVAVCRRLEGMPLALELAAARVRMFSPREILTRLDRPLDLLRGGPVDASPRQQSLRATLAWSFNLLQPHQQATLVRMGVFAGGCTLADLAAVATDPAGPAETLVDTVDALRRSSLVLREDVAQGEGRFRMLEVVREFCLEHLAANPATDVETRSRHAAHYAELALGLGPQVQGPRQVEATRGLEQDHDNIRASLRWLAQTGEADIGLRVAAALWMFWYTRGYATEGRSHLASLLGLPDAGKQSPVRARALLAAGQLARAQGDYPAAAAAMSESVAIYRGVDDPGGLAGALLGSAFVARMKEQHEVAMGLLREGLPLARAAGDQHVVAATLHHLGMIEAETGADADIVRGHLEEGLELYRGAESPRFIGLVLATLASIELSVDNLDRARELSRQSLEALGSGGDTVEIHWALDEISHILHREGKPEGAVRLAGAAAAMRQAIGVTTSPASTRRRAQMLDAARQSLGDIGFEAAWARGQAMLHAEALEEGAASVTTTHPAAR